MVNEEAIKILANFKRYISGGGVVDREENAAIDMAISALKLSDSIIKQLDCKMFHSGVNVEDTISDETTDIIYRQAAIDAMINSRSNADVTLVPGSYTNGWRDGRKLLLEELLQVVFELPSAQPASTRTFVELVVKYPDPELCTYKEYKGKPYYSIKYIENGETYVGYGTYNPEVLSQYLKEYFISSTQPEITPDGTLKVTVDADIASIGRILLSQTGTQRGGLYYKDAQPEPKWIPCKERLPDKDGLYLVTYFSGHARWTGTDEFLVDGTKESHWKYANIIAWQPLPKPFREGGDYA